LAVERRQDFGGHTHPLAAAGGDDDRDPGQCVLRFASDAS
jgi:hypothetical protein